MAGLIRAELKRLSDGGKKDDTVIVALSGQGVQFKGSPEVYFCPADAKLGDKSTLISLGEVYKALEKSPAGVKLVLLDVAHREPQSENSRASLGEVLETLPRPQRTAPPAGIALLTSASEGQEAYEHVNLKHGVFFHFVIGGISGAAAEGAGTDVTLARLEPFVKEKVTAFVREKYGEKQVPLLAGQTTASAPIARADEAAKALRRGKELAASGDFEKALEKLDEAVRLKPSLAAARVARGLRRERPQEIRRGQRRRH